MARRTKFLAGSVHLFSFSFPLANRLASGKREKERKRKNKSTIHGPEAGRLFLFLSLFSFFPSSSATGQEEVEEGKEKIIKKMLIEKETNCGQHSFTFSSAIFFHNLILSVSFFSFLSSLPDRRLEREKKKKETHGWFLMIGRFSFSLLRPIYEPNRGRKRREEEEETRENIFFN